MPNPLTFDDVEKNFRVEMFHGLVEAGDRLHFGSRVVPSTDRRPAIIRAIQARVPGQGSVAMVVRVNIAYTPFVSRHARWSANGGDRV